jgi:predicted nucleic acid-binding protein
MTIVDASVATAWFVEIGTSRSARPLLSRDPLLAPSLLRVEVASALFKYVRAELLSVSVPLVAVRALDSIVHEWVEDAALLPAAISLAVENRHKVYDCLYLVLALERREPLVTADRRLAAMAQELSINVELIEPTF